MARRRGAFWHDADCTYAFNALEKTRHHNNAIGKNGATDNELVVTGYSVRPGGIWLYHRRDLPAAHGERCRLTIVNRPSLDVSRLINCAWLLWLAMGSKTLGGFALPDGEFAGAGYLCAAYSRQRLASLAYHQQSWFWRYLYGHDISGDDYRPPTERTGKSQSFRLCDAHLRHWANPRPGADQYAQQWNIGACQRHSLRRGGVVYCCAYQHSAII